MKYTLLLLLSILLAGCAASAPAETIETVVPTQPPATEETLPPATLPPDPVETLLAGLTVEEKVGQLFLARCPETGALEDVSAYHLAGYTLYDPDLRGQTPETLSETLAGYQKAADIPLVIAVDEEGGTVCRVSAYSAFRHSPFPSPRSLYGDGGLDMVLAIEGEKAWLLSSLGINVNLGPVCDITTDPGAFLYSRSLGQSPEITGQFALGTASAMGEYNIGTVLKHFPGYGNNADTHVGIAVDNRTLETLASTDLVPFRMAIDGGCGAVMVAHTIVTALDGQLPASLSPAVHSYLRETMAFEGVILTDDLAMEAITDVYGAEEAAVLAVLAGNDLLCSTDYEVQYPAVLEAVQSGRISGDILDAAVTRVLRWKQALGLIA